MYNDEHLEAKRDWIICLFDSSHWMCGGKPRHSSGAIEMEVGGIKIYWPHIWLVLTISSHSNHDLNWVNKQISGVYLHLTVQRSQSRYPCSFMNIPTLHPSPLILAEGWQLGPGESWDGYNQPVICIGEELPELRYALAPGCPEGTPALWCPHTPCVCLGGWEQQNQSRPGGGLEQQH